jgi:1-deoxy-D-xylulose-5-phosphate synthase
MGVVEDDGPAGGVGPAAAQTLRDADADVPLREPRIPQRFLPHGRRGELLAGTGLAPLEIAGRIGATPARSEGSRR